MTTLRGLALIAFAALAPWSVAEAHSGGASYVDLVPAGDHWSATVDLPLPDAAREFALDADGDGQLRWGEVLDGTTRIGTGLARRLVLQSAGRACPATLAAPLELMRRDTGPHLRVLVRYECATAAATLDARGWLTEVPDHGIYLQIDSGQRGTSLLAGSVQTYALDTGAAPSATSQALRFVALGIEHLLTGYDHLAFLALLLLGAGRAAAARQQGWRPLLVEAGKVVSAFTAAHSITLALAATGTVQLPPAGVEAVIAFTIVLTAVSLGVTRGYAPGWRLAFAFGLVHGLGFAAPLAELLGGAALAVPLVAFNFGLELAQLGLVALAVPLLGWLARRPAWQTRLTPALSWGLALLGTHWLLERL